MPVLVLTQMKQLFTGLVLYLAYLLPVSGQTNLVVNPSFEQMQGCPNITGNAVPDSLTGWYNPTSNSVDAFLSCLNPGDFSYVPFNAWGNQMPRTGANYIGISADYSNLNYSQRDYVGGTLMDTLQLGKKYLLELYINSSSRYSSHFKDLGVYFSDTMPTKKYDPFPVIYFAELPFVPQVVFDTMITDTVNWVRLSDTLIATGEEKYFVIGLFLNNQNATFDTVYYDTTNQFTIAYYYIDDVSLTLIEDTTEPPPTPPTYPEIKVYPIPSNDGIFSVEYTLPNGGEMTIHNALGQIVGRVSLESGANLKNLSFINLASGVYHYRIMADGLEQKAGKLVISR